MQKLAATMLGKAIHALQAVAKRSDLPPDECGLILQVLPPSAPAAKLLSARLRKMLTPAWIAQGDLYQVFAALAALWHYDSTHISGKQLTASIQRLVSCEVTAGGPYHNEGKISVAANAQIALFIQMAAKPLPGLDAFLQQAAVSGQHNDDDFIAYLLHKTGHTPRINAAAAPLQFAILLKSNPQKMLAHLKKSQPKDGLWSNGSTAAIAQALADYLYTQQDTILHTKQNLVLAAAEQQVLTYDEPLKIVALNKLNQIREADTNAEITLFAYFFAQALKTPAALSRQQFTKLGTASVFGWVAYTIYDDFIDGGGKPADLPLANIAMRTSLQCFAAVLPSDKFARVTSAAFNEMDQANAWELANCRFAVNGEEVVIGKLPNYSQGQMLAARSFAHALGPMAVAILANVPVKKQHVVESAFRHYLIARQLNDDLRDWHDDLSVGQASYVVAAILRDAHIKPGTHELATLLPAMQLQFRKTTMARMCQQIVRHTEESLALFAGTQLLESENDIYKLLNSLRESAKRSLDNHAKMQTLYASASKFEQ